MATVAPPARTDIAGTPSNAVAKTAFGVLHDYLLNLLGSAGSPADARTALGSTATGDALFTTASASAARATLGSTATGDALFTTASASAARTTLDVYSKSETDTKLDNPAFSAYVAANQTITSSTWTKVNFDTEEFDIGSCYDTTLKRWTPNKPGYYYVGGFFNNVNSTGLSISVASVYKNGASFKQVGDTRGSLTGAVGGGCLIYLNGTTDYIELHSYITATTAIILGGATTSVFYGYFVRT